MARHSPGESASRAKPALTDSPLPVCALSTSVISAHHSFCHTCSARPNEYETGVHGKHRLGSPEPCRVSARVPDKGTLQQHDKLHSRESSDIHQVIDSCCVPEVSHAGDLPPYCTVITS